MLQHNLAVESQDLIENKDSDWGNELNLWCGEVLYIPPTQDSWYADLSYFLHHCTFPEYLKPRERRELILKSTRYSLINSMIFHLNYHGVFLRCLEKEDVESMLKELHDGHVRGHFAGETMTHNILRVGYYWPTIFSETLVCQILSTVSILCRQTMPPYPSP